MPWLLFKLCQSVELLSCSYYHLGRAHYCYIGVLVGAKVKDWLSRNTCKYCRWFQPYLDGINQQGIYLFIWLDLKLVWNLWQFKAIFKWLMKRQSIVSVKYKVKQFVSVSTWPRFTTMLCVILIRERINSLQHTFLSTFWKHWDKIKSAIKDEQFVLFPQYFQLF